MGGVALVDEGAMARVGVSGVVGRWGVMAVLVLASGLLAATARAHGSDFTSDANRICVRMIEHSPTPPNTEHPTAQQWVRFLVPPRADFVAVNAQFAKLTPPARLKTHFARFLEAMRSFLAPLPRLISLARSGDAAAVLRAFNAMPNYDAVTTREARAMGLKQCTQ